MFLIHLAFERVYFFHIVTITPQERLPTPNNFGGVVTEEIRRRHPEPDLHKPLFFFIRWELTSPKTILEFWEQIKAVTSQVGTFMGLSDDLCHQGPHRNSTCRTGKVNLPGVCNPDEVPWHSIIFTRLTQQLLEQNLWNFQQICGKDAHFVCAMFYFSLRCYSEDIDEEALLFDTSMYNDQGCGAGAGAGAAGADTFWSEPEPEPEPSKRFARSRSWSRSRKNGAAPAPKRDTIMEK